MTREWTNIKQYPPLELNYENIFAKEIIFVWRFNVCLQNVKFDEASSSSVQKLYLLI